MLGGTMPGDEGTAMPLSFNLKANHKIIMKDCAGPNMEFLKCKAENNEPKACLEFA